MSDGAVLRRMLGDRDVIVAPGIFDGVSARLAEQHGFRAAYVSGAAASAALLGLPDIGLTSLGEAADHVRRLADATSLPLIVDGDTGFGEIGNVIRTVRMLERAGAAAIHLEDQVFPKRCGHFPGKEVIAAGEFERKLRAALDARRDEALVIIARTDARAPLGLGEAIERANRYHAAGADLVFIDAPQGLEEVERIAREVEAPKLINMIANSGTPVIDAPRLGELGFRIAIYPLVALGPAAGAMGRALSSLKAAGNDRAAAAAWSPVDLGEAMGLTAWNETIARYQG